jgi:hypothetical protein
MDKRISRKWWRGHHTQIPPMLATPESESVSLEEVLGGRVVAADIVAGFAGQRGAVLHIGSEQW